MLPHTNAGILAPDEMARLAALERVAGADARDAPARACARRAWPHHYAPDKEPAVRLRMHEEAGELQIPFTSGILLGIGETAEERVDTLLAIRALADRYGHIQE